MSDLGQAYVQIVPKATGISGKISNLLAPGSKAAGEASGKSIASGIKGAIVKAGIGVAVVKTIKDAISEGGKLEQSFGGLETIYGDASDQAKRFAWNASKAGISANDYAEQAVSFGASLKQAFGGDTTKAVKAANTAIMDMTDNAAKMGTPIENIQNAYQGFAKQNYTMLDNLKLGYGGTKKEMERLLSDAEKLTGQKYDINNLGDVYDAIHAVQGELGLTGVAAQEASETFEGSFNAMKANWKNLLAQMAIGGEEVGPMMAEFADSAATFLFDNLIPMVGNVAKAIPEALGTFITVGAPKLADAGLKLLKSLTNGIKTSAPKIAEAIPVIIDKVKTGITTFVPQLLSAGGELLQALGEGIITYGPQILSYLGTTLSSLVTYIGEHLPEWAAKGGELLGALARAFIEHIPDMLSALGQFAQWLVQNLAKLATTLVKSGWELVKGIGRGIVQGIGSAISPAMQSVGNSIKTSIEGIKSFISNAWNTIKSLTSAAWSGVKSITTSAWNGIKSGVTAAANGIKSALSSAWGVIKSAASSAWNGIKQAITHPIETARSLLQGIMNKIKSIFPVNLGKICNLKIPQIHISGGKAPWGIGGKGTKPSFSVTWAAQGGIVDGATLIGAGEAGAEAIVPLDPFWNRLDEDLNRDRIDYDLMAQALIKALSQVDMVNELVCDGRVIAKATAPYMQAEQERLTKMSNRKLGYVS